MTISITLFFVGSSADAEITHEAKVVSGTIQSMVSATGGDTIELEEKVMINDDSTVNETVDEDDSMMDETMLRPRQQMESGIEPQDVVCKEGLLLILRTSDGSAACVTESSSTRLIDMGWGSLG